MTANRNATPRPPRPAAQSSVPARDARIARSLAVGIVTLLGTSEGAAAAQNLTHALPAPAVLYAEWSGSDVAAPAQADTPFGKLLADPGLTRLIDESARAIAIAVRKQAADQGDAQTADDVIRLLRTLWHRPVALDVLGFAMTDAGPTLEAVLAVDVGRDDAPAFTRSVESLLSRAVHLPPATPEEIRGRSFKRLALPFVPAVRYAAIDDLFVVTVGQATPDKLLFALKGASDTVARDPSFLAATGKIGTARRQTLSVFHLNVAAALDQGRRFWSAMNGSDRHALPQAVENVLSASGLNRLRSVTGLWQVDAGAYRESWFIALPPENGRPRWLNQAPVTDADLAGVPSDVTFAKVANFRLADLYAGLMYVVDTVGPPVQTRVANAIASAEAAMGLRIRDDILDLLDDGWVWYLSPSNGGILFTGLTGLIEVKDPDRAVELLQRLVRAVARAAPRPSGSATPIFNVERTSYKNNTIHYVAATGPPIPVAPAWAVHGNQLVVGFHPQTVMHALDHLTASPPAPSLLDNPDFARARKAVPRRCTAIVYTDTRSFMTDLYKLLLPAATAFTGWARSEGVAVNPAMIPARDTFVADLFGDIIATASDADGVLLTTFGPLPFSALIPAAPAFTAAMSVSVLLPSLARARELSKRAVSVANARTLITACQIYAHEHGGKFPPDLETLVKSVEVDRAVLHSPRDARDRVSYLYVAGHNTGNPPDTVILYENPAIGNGEGSAVAFADGHADWIDAAELQRLLHRHERQLTAPDGP